MAVAVATATDRLLVPFLCAAADGDVESLELMLDEDAVLYADEVIVGAARIADFMAEDPGWAFDLELATIDGRPGRLLRGFDGTVRDALSIDGADGRIHAVYVVRA
jgi:hypothetical protein